MKTLPKEIWNQNFESKEQYLEYKKLWAAFANSREIHDPGYFLLNAILRGKNWTKCFAPNTSEYIIRNAIDFVNCKEFMFKHRISKIFGETIMYERLQMAKSRMNISGFTIPEEAYKD